MSKTKFDFIIVGSGIEALTRCLQLEKQGSRGALIEKEDVLGGLFRGLRNNDAVFESHLPFLPDTPSLHKNLSALKEWLPQLNWTAFDVGPVTFQNGQVQPFVGFGETSNEAVDLYTQMTGSSQLQLSLRPTQMIAELRKQLTSEIYNLSEVTSLELAPNIALTLNGNSVLTAETLYYFESPLRLSKLLLHSQTPLPKNLVPKLSKTSLWTAISLIYQHSASPTESSALHILYGSKEQPCLGRFQKEWDLPTSQWLCLVGPEVTADSEALGGTIREMKKQIKRMFPHFFDSVEKENIIVSPESYGAINTQLLQNDTFPKVARLHLGSHFVTNGLPLGGDLDSLGLASTIDNDSDTRVVTQGV